MATVLLTVPHAACPKVMSDLLHTCDTAAPRAARELQASLERAGMRSELLVATVPRKYSDMNRSESRGSEWRTRVEAAMSGRGKRPNLLLDVHSFPARSAGSSDDAFYGKALVVMILEKFTTELGKRVKFGEGREAVQFSRNFPWQADMVKYVQKNADLPIGMTYGSLANDLMVRAEQSGIPSALLEFSEDLSQQDLKRICDALAAFVSESVVLNEHSGPIIAR